MPDCTSVDLTSLWAKMVTVLVMMASTVMGTTATLVTMHTSLRQCLQHHRRTSPVNIIIVSITINVIIISIIIIATTIRHVIIIIIVIIPIISILITTTVNIIIIIIIPTIIHIMCVAVSVSTHVCLCVSLCLCVRQCLCVRMRALVCGCVRAHAHVLYQ